MTEKMTKEGNLFKSVAQGKFRTVYAILESGQDPNIRDREHWTPLMRAIYLTREDVRSHIVRLLVKYKADVNLCDKYGRTALIHACGVIGRLDVIRRIIATSKCDVCVCDQDGNTAIMTATLKNNPSAIRILVNSSFTKDRVRIDTKNCIDETALSIAAQLGYKDCALILMNEGSANIKYVADQTSLYKLLQDRRSLHRISIASKMKRAQASMCSLDEAMHSLSSIKLEKISLHSKSSLSSKLDYDVIAPCSHGLRLENTSDEIDSITYDSHDTFKDKTKKRTHLRRREKSYALRNLTSEKIDELSEPTTRSSVETEEIISLNPFGLESKGKAPSNAFSSNMLGFSGGHHRLPPVSKKKYVFMHNRQSLL